MCNDATACKTTADLEKCQLFNITEREKRDSGDEQDISSGWTTGSHRNFLKQNDVVRCPFSKADSVAE